MLECGTVMRRIKIGTQQHLLPEVPAGSTLGPKREEGIGSEEGHRPKAALARPNSAV